MRNSIDPPAYLRRNAALLCWLVAVCLSQLPASALDAARAWHRQSLAPVWRLAFALRSAGQQLTRWCHGAAARGNELDRLRAKLATAQLEVVSLRAALERQQTPSPVARRSSHPRLHTELIPARMLGRQARSMLEQLEVIEAGSLQAVRPEALVLASVTKTDPPSGNRGGLFSPLSSDLGWIDAGRDAGIAPASRVLCAGVIWGRVIEVGRYASCVRRVGHPLYRDVVQLAAPLGQGLRAGPRGLLRGGHPCRVELVDAKEPVRAGDLVLAAGEQGLIDGVLIYGSVSRVDHKPGQPYWEIEVDPTEPPAWEEHVWVISGSPDPHLSTRSAKGEHANEHLIDAAEAADIP